jgi:hypothetical protein
LPAIWQKNDDSRKLGKAAQAEAAKLNEIALKRTRRAEGAGDRHRQRPAKACHDEFRSPDYEKENETSRAFHDVD